LKDSEPQVKREVKELILNKYGPEFCDNQKELDEWLSKMPNRNRGEHDD